MTILKNKILTKPTKKLIFIISILMIIALNLFGAEEEIKFEYYYYTNKLYHSTLKTEIIPSEYVFITTYSNENNRYSSYENRYKDMYSYIYNLKTKEKKLFYACKTKINTNKDYYEVRTSSGYYYDTRIVTNYEYLNEYYDIKGNLTTNWTDTNMRENELYEVIITNNRFGETFSFYNRYDKYIENEYIREIISMTKNNNYGNDYIQKAYKYSLTQPEIINKKDKGIYIFKKQGELFNILCFQNEYYNGYYYIYYLKEGDLLNYDSTGRVIFNNCYSPFINFHYTYYSSFGGRKCIDTNSGGIYSSIDNIYFQLNNKSFTKPTWNEFTNNFLNYIKKHPYKQVMDEAIGFYYSKKDTENNSIEYKKLIDIEFLGFIPIEEFEYYLLAD